MNIRIASVPYTIAFRQPLVTAAGTFPQRRGFWIAIRDEDGLMGFGEAAPLPGFTRESLEEAEHILQGGFDALKAAGPETTAYAGLLLAMLDLAGRRAGRRVAEMLSPAPRTSVPVNALLRSSTPAEAAAEAAEAHAKGFQTLKLKVGAGTPDEDEQRIAAVRDAVGANVKIRIDANASWDVETAVRLLRRFERYDLEYVEQPVAEDLAAVRKRVGVPIAADESVRGVEQARRLIADSAVDVLILKPMAFGGVMIGHAIALEAFDAGVDVVVTSILDTPVGVAGALHLAASIPGPARACGLATVDLLEPTPAHGLDMPVAGMMSLPARPGHGVDLDVPIQW